MKTLLLQRNVQIAAVLACGIGALGFFKAYSQDFNPQPDPPRFGLIGVTPASQFLRVSVTNYPGTVTGANRSCQAQVSFGNGEGQTLKQGTLTALPEGKSLTLDITAADLVPVTSVTGAPTSRYELQPAVRTVGSCGLVTSIQIVATETAQTSIYDMVAGNQINHNETLVRDTDSQ